MTSSTFFFIFIPLLAIILLAVNLIFAPHNPYQEKDSAFECGFHSFLGQNRTQFSISFFIFALLFLLFDLEILLVYPYVVSAHTNGIYGLVIMLIFFLALTLGFAFELGKNALKIDSRQMVALNNEAVSLALALSGFNKWLLHILNLGVKALEGFKKWLLHKLNFGAKTKTDNINNMYIVRCFMLSSTNNILGLSVFSVRRKYFKVYHYIVRAEGSYIYLENGQAIFDASGGAAVSCIGHTNAKVAKRMLDVLNNGLAYKSSAIFLMRDEDYTAKLLLDGMDNKMSALYFTGSGSEAVEAMSKTVLEYHYILDPKTKRSKFISRDTSYHGATTGALALSQMGARKEPFIRWLPKEVYTVSSCNPYRQRLEGETDAMFVAKKASELDLKFKELGPDTVAGFILEPVVGAAMGAVPFVPGYLKAMQEVCHKHGALLMLDEVMCGMGRTGYMHAWQAEADFVPDIQAVAKGLGGGFISVGAVFWHQRIVDVLETSESKGFRHAQTYQASPLQLAAVSAVQEIILEEKLLENMAKLSPYLIKKLKLALDKHPNVGDIRGMGFFIGIEFVVNKITKEPFDPKLNIAEKLASFALLPPYEMSFYPGSAGADGTRGDHLLIAPAYNITVKEVDHIVAKASDLIHDSFKQSTYLDRMSADLKSTFYSLEKKKK
jgi:adenosylmethionine-8-amino-7-oxononanoate aminotransferase/NADH:ubiquinone oxidoreductase subunit 3 (subunit A)